MGATRSEGSAPAPLLPWEPGGSWVLATWRSPELRLRGHPPLPSTSPPYGTHRAILLGDQCVWGGCHPRGGLFTGLAVALPSRRGLPPGLRSGLRPGSRSLFLFAQKNPSLRGSSQRRCAGRKGHKFLKCREPGPGGTRGGWCKTILKEAGRG